MLQNPRQCKYIVCIFDNKTARLLNHKMQNMKTNRINREHRVQYLWLSEKLAERIGIVSVMLTIILATIPSCFKVEGATKHTVSDLLALSETQPLIRI